MNLLLKRILGASLTLSAFSFVTHTTAQAQSCAVAPTCESLGYTDTAARCEGDAMVKCPFDTSKVFCRALLTTKTKICDTIGDVLLDDKSCAADINAIYQDRTPIGVVFDVDKKLAIALIHYTNVMWATSTVHIPDLPVISSQTQLKQDFNGKSNTSIIIAHGEANDYLTSAASNCYNYTTKGTSKGDWYLPAGGELQLIYDNVTKLNESLSKIGGTQFKKEIYTIYTWSSSEFSRNPDIGSPWAIDLSSGRMYSRVKNDRGQGVRPVLAY